jgi:hypothetical protein
MMNATAVVPIIVIPAKTELNELGPGELQTGMQKFKAWIDLFRKHRVIVGSFAAASGQHCLVIEAASDEHAAEIAKTCPAPEYGLSVTVLQ